MAIEARQAMIAFCAEYIGPVPTLNLSAAPERDLASASDK
jgi:hypothetical protein